MTKVLYKVHGIVQGVGYRALVKRMADACNLSGYVRNLDDGSVEILAIGNGADLSHFEKAIRVNRNNGPAVFHIERTIADARHNAQNRFVIV